MDGWRRLPGVGLLSERNSATATVDFPAAYAVPRAVADHLVQLDTLRAFAVLEVMVCHYFGAYPMIERYGGQGVKLFFVLSGFLITGILLRCRQLVDARQQSALFSLRQFYARRFLRIFPLYYLALLVMWLSDLHGIRQSIPWHVAYLTNVYVARVDDWVPGFGHFWSLAVEEQFYLVWPLLILFLPRRALLPMMAGAILIAPLFRIVGDAAGVSPLTIAVLAPGSLDSLGLGSVLAWLDERPAGHQRVARRWINATAVSGVVVVAASSWAEWHGIERLHRALAPVFYTGTSAVFAWAVHGAARGWRGIAGAIFRWRPLVAVGRISYGMYVIHYPMLLAVPAGLVLVGVTGASGVWRQALLMSLVTVTLAAASWHWYERPLNELKRHFPYRRAERHTP